jgi:hypothetical protein
MGTAPGPRVAQADSEAPQESRLLGRCVLGCWVGAVRSPSSSFSSRQVDDRNLLTVILFAHETPPQWHHQTRGDRHHDSELLDCALIESKIGIWPRVRNPFVRCSDTCTTGGGTPGWAWVDASSRRLATTVPTATTAAGATRRSSGAYLPSLHQGLVRGASG